MMLYYFSITIAGPIYRIYNKDKQEMLLSE